MIYINCDSWSAQQGQNNNSQIWPNLIAQKLEQDLVNESVGCGSNSRILDCLENFLICGNKPDLVIIALSGHARWHMPAPDLGHWLINSSVAINDKTGETDKLIRDWNYKKSYNDIDSIFRYYKSIWNIYELCKRFECKCIFFQAWDRDLIADNVIDNAESYVSKFYELSDIHAKTYLTGFKFFQQHKKHWNYVDTTTFHTLLTPHELDATLHPNQRGHNIISRFVYQQLLKHNLS